LGSGVPAPASLDEVLDGGWAAAAAVDNIKAQKNSDFFMNLTRE
jgi:hypothetical protein